MLATLVIFMLSLVGRLSAEVYKPVYVASLSVAGPYYTNKDRIEFRDKDTNSTASIGKKKRPRHYTLLPNILRMHFMLGNNLQESYPHLVSQENLKTTVSSYACAEPTCQQASQAFMMGLFPAWNSNELTPEID